MTWDRGKAALHRMHGLLGDTSPLCGAGGPLVCFQALERRPPLPLHFDALARRYENGRSKGAATLNLYERRHWWFLYY